MDEKQERKVEERHKDKVITSQLMNKTQKEIQKEEQN